MRKQNLHENLFHERYYHPDVTRQVIGHTSTFKNAISPAARAVILYKKEPDLVHLSAGDHFYFMKSFIRRQRRVMIPMYLVHQLQSP